MEESTSREKVLKQIRDALIEQTEAPYPIIDTESQVYQEITDPLDVTFAENLLKVQGKFVYCDNEEEFYSTLQAFILEKDWPLIFCFDNVIQSMLKSAGIPYESNKDKITEAGIGITRCENLVARFGSVVVSSRLSPGRKINVFPGIHLVLAYSSQLVPELKDAFRNLKKKYQADFPSMVSVITGPSRTADIEKTLVLGAHGPKELYVFLIEDTVHPV